MNVNGALEKRIGSAREHDEAKNLHQLPAFRAQDGRPQNPVTLGVDHDFHKPGRLAALDSPGYPGGGNLPDFELLPRGPRLALRHSYPAQLWIGEDRVGNEAVVAAQ